MTYDKVATVDEDYNFNPEVRQALADSDEMTAKIAASNAGSGASTNVTAWSAFIARASERLTGPLSLVFCGSSSIYRAATAIPNSWPSKFSAMVQERYPANVTPAMRTLAAAVTTPPSGVGIHPITAGVSGSRTGSQPHPTTGVAGTPYLTPTTRAQIVTLNPAVILHAAHTNDYGHGITPAVVKANYLANLQDFDARGYKGGHILVHPYQRYDAAGEAAKVAPWSAYLAVLYEIAASRPDTSVVEVASDFIPLGVPGTDWLNLIDPDEIHMTEPKGTSFYADLMEKKILGGRLIVSAPSTPVTAPVITTTSVNPLVVGSAMSVTLGYTGTTPTSWAVTSGSLPAGLTLNTGSGVISGTPSAAGSYNFTVTATNSAGSDPQAFTGTVSAAITRTLKTSDSFSGAAVTTMSGKSTDAAAGGSPIAYQSSAFGGFGIDSSNRLYRSAGATEFLGVPIAEADIDFEITVPTLTSALGTVLSCLDFRRSAVASGAQNNIRLRVLGDGSLVLTEVIAGTDSGTGTPLGSAPSGSYAAGAVIRARMIGSSVKIFVNGVQVIDATTTVLAAGLNGFAKSSAVTSVFYDDLKIYALS